MAKAPLDLGGDAALVVFEALAPFLKNSKRLGATLAKRWRRWKRRKVGSRQREPRANNEIAANKIFFESSILSFRAKICY
jgi:hypothetical protein